MKRLFSFFSLVMIICIMSMISCNKSEQDSSALNARELCDSRKSYFSSICEIDAIANEMAILHNFELKKLYADPFDDSMTRIQLAEYVESMQLSDCKSLRLSNLAGYLSTPILEPIRSLLFQKMTVDTGSEETRQYPIGIDGAMIDSSFSLFLPKIINIYWYSNSFEEYQNKCQMALNSSLPDNCSLDEYFYLRIGLAIAQASFDVWIELLYGEDSEFKEASTWDKIKKRAKKIAKEAQQLCHDVEPYVKADWDGALRYGGNAALLAAMSGVGTSATAHVVCAGVAIGTVVGSVSYSNNHK